MNNVDNKDSISIIEESQSKTIIVAFGGISQGMGMPVFEFFNIMNDKPYTKVFIRDKKQAWYHSGIDEAVDISLTVTKLSQLLSSLDCENKKVVFIGNSAGGYAAIVYGLLLKVDKIIAFSPQTFLGKFKRLINRDKRWGAQIRQLHINQRNPDYFLNLYQVIKKFQTDSTDINIYFGLDSVLDLRHYNNIKSLPLTFYLFPYGGHGLIKELKKRGILEQLLNYI